MSTTIGEFVKNKREIIRVGIDTYQGYDLVDIRSWYRTENGDHKPSRSGISLRVDLLPDLQEAVSNALARARENGLID